MEDTGQIVGWLQICGTIKGEKGIQRAEAMLYAIDRINEDQTLLPGITLGCHILDTCLRDTYALEQSLEFIRPYMSSWGTEVQLCDDGLPPPQDTSQQQLKPIAGVIGASASVVSVMVANMLQLFKVRPCHVYTLSTLCLKNAPTLASCSFDNDKRGLILIILSKHISTLSIFLVSSVLLFLKEC